MSFFTPSAGEILGICQFALSTYTAFRDAPAEFQLITSDCEALHTILCTIQHEAEDPWAPINRDSASVNNMNKCLQKTSETLRLLDEQLAQYHSLGTNEKRVLQRAKYVTENFTELRARMQRDRSALDSLINVATNDVVGRIYKEVRHLAAAIRTKKNTSTIISGRGGRDDEDTWTVIKSQIYVPDVTEVDLERLRPQIEPYALKLQREGAFDEEAQSEIRPYDSVTVVDSEYNAPSYAGTTKTVSGSLDTLRSAPIEGLSYRTISNPGFNTKGYRRPGTFDLWKLADRCWTMQSICTRELSNAGRLDTTGSLLSELLNCLTKLNPALILSIADSSTDSQRIWYHWKSKGIARLLHSDLQFTYLPTSYTFMDKAYISISESVLFPGYNLNRLLDANLVTCGEELLILLEDIERSVTASQNLATTSKSAALSKLSLQLPPSKDSQSGSKLKRLFRHRSSSNISTSLADLEHGGPESEPMSLRQQVTLVQAYCERYTRYYYVDTLWKQNFESRMEMINERWRGQYLKARAPQAANIDDPFGEFEGADNDLLLKWLLEAVHGQSIVESHPILQLSRDLDFPNYEDHDTLEQRNTAVPQQQQQQQQQQLPSSNSSEQFGQMYPMSLQNQQILQRQAMQYMPLQNRQKSRFASGIGVGTHPLNMPQPQQQTLDDENAIKIVVSSENSSAGNEDSVGGRIEEIDAVPDEPVETVNEQVVVRTEADICDQQLVDDSVSIRPVVLEDEDSMEDSYDRRLFEAQIAPWV